MNDLLKQAFPVEDNKGDDDHLFDSTKPPTSAQEYLKRVRQEANRSPDVVVAKINRDVFRSKQTVTVSDSNGFLPAPSGYEPTLSWQRKQASEFSELRQRLGRHKTKLINQATQTKPTLPDDANEDQWCRFCFGEDFLHRLKARRGQSYSTSSNDGETDKKAPSSNDGEMDGQAQQSVVLRTNGVPPLLSIVAYISQATLHQVLEYHVSWFQHVGFSLSQGCWFYALMALLEKPLLPDAASMIRELARLCAAQRAALESAEDERLSSLNLLIALVIRYFDQTDLCNRR
ncbi:LOW QUALITY PROTEIN: gem-associated protein 2-like [Amphiura filiformis]|uniref:LOW QUALITY PROTEIN: gem-associated protein 2-like n=1 Tax=Amphiura filiformis TaxID=82378 RepID=UPI003B217CF0